MKRTDLLKWSAGVLAAIALAGSGAATAQQSGGNYGNQPPPQQGQPTDFSDEELSAFADAQIEVREISQKYQSKLSNAEGPEETNKIRNQANQEMAAAVNNAGLDPATFNAISQAARNDRELASKIQSME